MVDCKYADHHRPFTPCELCGGKPCRPEGCEWRETEDVLKKGGDNHGLQTRNEERRT